MVSLILFIDSHESGYLGVVVQLYVQAQLGHLQHLNSEGIQLKTDDTAEIHAHFCLFVPNLNYYKLVESIIQPHVKVHVLF